MRRELLRGGVAHRKDTLIRMSTQSPANGVSVQSNTDVPTSAAEMNGLRVRYGGSRPSQASISPSSAAPSSCSSRVMLDVPASPGPPTGTVERAQKAGN